MILADKVEVISCRSNDGRTSTKSKPANPSFAITLTISRAFLEEKPLKAGEPVPGALLGSIVSEPCFHFRKNWRRRDVEF